MNASVTVYAALVSLWAVSLPAHSAPVSPNPKSLLRNKRVLVVEATRWNGGSHLVSKANGLAALEKIKAAVGIANMTVVDDVESYSVAALAPYDIIVFNYVFNTQMAVGKPFEAAFKTWLASGNKGWMGYHSSGANEAGEWPWYRDSVTVMRYHVHSVAAQPGKLTITADPAVRAHPILQGMDETFTATDEWYDFDLPPRAPAPAQWADCKVTYYLDEATLATTPTRPMNPHPMAWFREDFRRNRFYYSAFVHSDAGSASDFFYSSLLRGLEYLAGYDSSVSVSSQGNSIRTQNGLSYITASRELRVEAAGPYKVEVFSTAGRTVARMEGEGPALYRPAAFRQAGVYYLRYAGKGLHFTQRILVY